MFLGLNKHLFSETLEGNRKTDLPMKPIDLPKTNNPFSAPISTNSSASSLKQYNNSFVLNMKKTSTFRLVYYKNNKKNFREWNCNKRGKALIMKVETSCFSICLQQWQRQLFVVTTKRSEILSSFSVCGWNCKKHENEGVRYETQTQHATNKKCNWNPHFSFPKINLTSVQLFALFPN